MLEIKLQQQLDLDLTLDSGQCFRWNKFDGWWYGVVDGNVWKCRVEDEILLFEVFGKDAGSPIESRMTLRNYFNFNSDYLFILNSFAKDSTIKNLTQELNGLIVLNQDPYETLLSYILMANNNVPRVKLMVQTLSKKFGRKIKTDIGDFFTFPTLSELQNVSEENFRDLKFGFRAKYFRAAVVLF